MTPIALHSPSLVVALDYATTLDYPHFLLIGAALQVLGLPWPTDVLATRGRLADDMWMVLTADQAHAWRYQQLAPEQRALPVTCTRSRGVMRLAGPDIDMWYEDHLNEWEVPLLITASYRAPGALLP